MALAPGRLSSVIRCDLLFCLCTWHSSYLQRIPESRPTRGVGPGEPHVWGKVLKGGHVREMTDFGAESGSADLQLLPFTVCLRHGRQNMRVIVTEGAARGHTPVIPEPTPGPRFLCFRSGVFFSHL